MGWTYSFYGARIECDFVPSPSHLKCFPEIQFRVCVCVCWEVVVVVLVMNIKSQNAILILCNFGSGC